jgi:1-acyl-sn-glycerol-3-phosphate acyltransferase
MLYKTLRFLFSLTVKGYFRSVTVSGRENIPERGPLIFAPNHPSAFMDPILLATAIPRRLHFLARGDIFRSKLASALLGALNMVPVYRRDETPGHEEKNDEVFHRCFDHLVAGRCLMIFPEGSSKTERNLRPLKMGAARIALGAEALHGFSLGVQIIPVGINYSNPHNFRTDVLINFGPPIASGQYAEEHKADERKAVVNLIDKLKTELEKLLVIVQDERLDKLVRHIEQVYRGQLRQGMEPGEKGLRDFQLSKEIVSAVGYHIANDPDRVERFEESLEAYLSGLDELSLRDTQLRASAINLNVVKTMLLFVAGFPLWLYGYATNYIPYRLAGLVSNALPFRDDFVGSVKITVGTLVFLTVYISETILVSRIAGFWWGLTFVVSLYPAGVFTLTYINRYFRAAGTVRYLRMFIQRTDLIAKLKTTRQQLINELETGRKEYLAAREAAELAGR